MQAYVVVFLQVLKVLVLVLPERLSDFRVCDDIKDGLRFLL